MLFSHVGFLASISLSALASIQVSAAEDPWTLGQSVKTSSGAIKGHGSQWQTGVSEYLGIPYAQPPVGDLRWAAPKPFKSDATFAATKYSASCPANIVRRSAEILYNGTFAQTLLGVVGQLGEVWDEDCLTLNVWTKPQVGEKAKAVLIWIYGGGFGSGNTNNPTYNGARLANEEDVVIVSINYRLNIFGFPKAPFLPDLNLGLLDQRLAVEWVRNNIAAFGGDPKRITLFGQSAGGASVDYYTYAWTKDPIAIGFIPESGSVSPNSNANPTNTGSAWYEVASKLGCNTAQKPADNLPCMRSKKWEDIYNVMEKRGVTPPANGFSPTVDNKVVFGDIAKRRREGNFIKAPMLVGNNNNEGGFYQLLGAAQGAGPKGSPSPKSGGAPPSLMNLIGCGSSGAALARRAQGISAWRYLYAGEWPNQDIGYPGAYHLAEIPLVFGTTEYVSHRQDTAEEIKLSSAMRKAWATFAKDPVNGLAKLGWPMYDGDKPTVIRLGGPNSSEIAFESRQKHDVGCPTTTL